MKATPNALARALRVFFADYLPRVCGMSPHTVCSYRDAFTLLLRFLAKRRRRSVVVLDFQDLAPDAILAFLHHLESDRRNAAASRNARLAAIHAFARFAAANHPEHLELCQRILAVPFKRARPRIVEYLEAGEIGAILDAPDRTRPDGRRDHALFLTLFNTGARPHIVAAAVWVIESRWRNPDAGRSSASVRVGRAAARSQGQQLDRWMSFASVSAVRVISACTFATYGCRCSPTLSRAA